MRGLSDQIDDRPVIFAALNVITSQANQLASTQSATKRDGQHRPIPLPL
jgi:hypothetical protein